MILKEKMTPGTIVRGAKPLRESTDRRIERWDDNYCVYRARGSGEPFSGPDKKCWITTIEDWAKEIIPN